MIYRKESNFIYSCLSALHRGSFSIVRQVLENNIVNLIIYLIIIFFETLQVCPVFLSIGFRVVDKQPQAVESYKELHNALTTINVTKLVLESNFYVQTVVSFFMITFYLLSMGITIYCSPTKIRKKETTTSKIVIWTCTVASLLFVLMEFLLSFLLFLWLLMPYTCNRGETTTFSSNPRITCWTGIHLVVVIINGVNLFFHFVYLFVFNMLFTDTSPRSNIPWACTQANKTRLLKVVSKLILALFMVFDPRAKSYNYLFILEIFVHGFIVYILFMSPPYINRIAGRTAIFLEFYTLFTMISMYILRLLDKIAPFTMLITSETAFVILSALVVIFKSKYDSYIISIEVTTNRSESFKEYYFYELFRLLDKYTSDSQSVAIELYGIYTNHQLTCKNPACNCVKGLLNKNATAQRLKENSDGEQNGPVPGMEAQYESIINTFRADMPSMFQIKMDRSIDCNPDSKEEDNKEEDVKAENYKLLIDMCSLLIDFEVSNNFGSIPLRMISAYCFREYVGNVFKSVYELLFIEEKQKPSLRDQFLIYKYKRVIDEEISALAKKTVADTSIDVEKIMEFESYYETFRKQAETIANLANRFWEQLKSKDLDVNGLYEIGSKMGIIYKEMQKNCNAAIELFPHNFKIYSEFGNFERYIMNNDMVAKNYNVKAKQIMDEQIEQNREGIRYYENGLVNANPNSRTFICMVSGNPSTLGDIISVNTEITQILGFKPKEIIGQNCGILCPQYISSKHNQIIENFIMRGSSTFLKTRQILTACNSNGFLVLLEAYVKLYPSIYEGIRYIGIFKTLEDYSEFFKEKEAAYLESDFGLIVTSMDGKIFGVNETCMRCMGIPISIFKSKNVGEDAIMINTLIKEIDDAEIENKLLQQGMDMICNTKALQFSINKENLTKKEVRALKKKAGKYNVFVKMSNEVYGEGLIKIKMYKMIVQGKEEEEPTKLLNLNSEPLKEDKQWSEKEDSYPEEERANLSDTKLKDLSELKQRMNTNSLTINVSTIKCGVNIIFLLVVIAATATFALLIIDKNQQMRGHNIVFSTNRREIDISLICSFAFIINYLVKNPSHQRIYENVDLFEYAREYGYRSIYILRNKQDYLNALDFDYNEKLKNLEKRVVVEVISRGSDNRTHSTWSSINTAITQYSGQASNYFANSYDNLLSRVNELEEYFFVKENGIGNIPAVAIQSEKEFRARLDQIGRKDIYYLLGIMIFIAVVVGVCFIVITPKLVSLQREKINVFLLYVQMNKREVNQQMEKCMEFQKSKGFLDYEEAAEPEGSSENLKELRIHPKTITPFRLKITQIPETEELSKKSEANSEYESDSENSEESVKDENEIIILEQLDSEKLKSKLTTNALMLGIMIFALFCVLIGYFIVSYVKHYLDTKIASDKRKIISDMTDTLNTPLRLLTHTLISTTENREILINNKDSLTFYMNQFLDIIRFQQFLTFSNIKYLNTMFTRLNSNQFCTVIKELYSDIRIKYPARRGIFSYDMQIAITETLCKSFGNDLLSRGMIQASFMIYYNAKRIRDGRNIGKTKFDLNDTVQLLIISHLFLVPATEALLINLQYETNNNLDDLMTFIIVFYILYLIISTFSHFLFWSCYLRSTERELVKSKGMLKIMPLTLIAKLKEMSKENEDNQSLRFFKVFEKSY